MAAITRTNSQTSWFGRSKAMSNHEQSNSENREHVKNFRNVNCVLANHNKVKITREQTSKPETIMFRFSYLAPYWLVSLVLRQENW